jgi:hypothetical protein
VTTGSGPSVGAALLDFGATGSGRRSSYRATGWHAQISKLTAVAGGHAASEAAGLSPTVRTLLAWLAEERTPSAANQARIASAYSHLAGSFPEELAERPLDVHGWVRIGDDERERGNGTPRSPFLVGDQDGGDWSRIRDEWNAGGLTPARIEKLFIVDVVQQDIDSLSDDTVSFPGSSYLIVAT